MGTANQRKAKGWAVFWEACLSLSFGPEGIPHGNYGVGSKRFSNLRIWKEKFTLHNASLAYFLCCFKNNSIKGAVQIASM